MFYVYVQQMFVPQPPATRNAVLTQGLAFLAQKELPLAEHFSGRALSNICPALGYKTSPSLTPIPSFGISLGRLRITRLLGQQTARLKQLCGSTNQRITTAWGP